MKSLIVLVIICFIGGRTYSQALQAAKANKLYSEAMMNYERGEFDSMAAGLEKAVKLRPDHPGILYNLAAAYARDNRPGEAVKTLDKIASMKLYFPVMQDSDFKSIWNSDLFSPVQKKFEENLLPVTSSNTAFELNEKGLLTEGLAYDPKTKMFFISSVHKRKIIAHNSKGESRQFNKDDVSLEGIFGMKADVKNRILWAAGGAIKFMEGYDDTLKGKSFLYKFSLDDGRLLQAYSPPETGGEHLFGDVTINSSGDVFVSDSRSNVIYKLEPDDNRLKTFIPSGYFLSLQGIAFSDDDSILYAADYSLGIFRISVSERTVELVGNNTSTTLLGIDGLYFYEGDLIATQNGVNPHRVLRLIPGRDITSINHYQILESNNPLFDEPTLGVIDSGNFYFISNSQWSRFDKSGIIFPDERLDYPRILKISLESSGEKE